MTNLKTFLFTQLSARVGKKPEKSEYAEYWKYINDRFTWGVNEFIDQMVDTFTIILALLSIYTLYIEGINGILAAFELLLVVGFIVFMLKTSKNLFSNENRWATIMPWVVILMAPPLLRNVFIGIGALIGVKPLASSYVNGFTRIWGVSKKTICDKRRIYREWRNSFKPQIVGRQTQVVRAFSLEHRPDFAHGFHYANQGECGDDDGDSDTLDVANKTFRTFLYTSVANWEIFSGYIAAWKMQLLDYKGGVYHG